MLMASYFRVYRWSVLSKVVVPNSRASLVKNILELCSSCVKIVCLGVIYCLYKNYSKDSSALGLASENCS